MTKTCPGCGATAPADARYCRHCGTALHSTGSNVGAETISPLANTEPLAGLPFDTSELNAKETQLTNTPAANTLASALAIPPAGLADDSVGTSGEITIPVVRNARAEQTKTTTTPDTVATAPANTVSNAATAGASSATAQSDAAPANDGTPAQVVGPPAPRPTKRRALGLWLGGGLVVGALMLCVVGAGVWFVLHRRSAAVATTNTNTNAPVVVAPDAQQQAQAKVAEAQKLLSAGDPVGATARLREAVALDPANIEAHRQLAQLLLENGARQTAIEELRAVTGLEPNDRDAWRQLAEAQFAEKQYSDAADSYHTLIGLAPEARTDERLQLAYADALRLAGRTDEASAIYKQLAASPLPDVAHTSKQRLAEITASAKATNTNARTQNTNEASNAQPTSLNQQAAVNPTPRPHTSSTPTNAAALSPAEHYQRGVSLWATNRAAAVTEFRAAAAGDGNPDAYYYLGLSFAEGRDPHTMGRAELVAALEFFQRARAGHFSAQARRYEDQLGQEFDRRHGKE
jgi:tetratricopeptide (TPR) repeat protein